jgi:hypothetical protein
MNEVVKQRIDRRHRLLPRPGDLADVGALRNLAVLADALADPLEFLDEPLVDLNELVELVGDLPLHPALTGGHPDGEVTLSQARKRIGQLPLVEAGRESDE